jgi:phosphonoacetaldehyde hydrolase
MLEAVRDLRARGIMIGSTTGYIRSMMDVLAPQASERGYAPDCIVCPDEVPAGRPYPWMCYQNAMALGVFPMQAMVKVGDTLPDIEEGSNAGMWTVGVSLTGNLAGLSESDLRVLSSDEKDATRLRAASQLYQAGAHSVIDGIWDLPIALEDIQARLSRGEHP